MQFKKILSIGALSLYSMLSLAKISYTSEKQGYITNEHCKFINGDSDIVINHKDTLSVLKTYKLIFYNDNHKQMTCDVQKKGSDIVYELTFNPEYYKTTPWLPPIQFGDSIASNLIKKDKKLIKEYYLYDHLKNYNVRDSIEQELLANRQKLIERYTSDNTR